MNKKLCVVVPYRDREQHLKEFIPSICDTLDKQKIDFHVIIVEQEPGKLFNRAKLLNVGYAVTSGIYDYYCFHDVDMIPLESDYSYCESPTHLAARAEQFDWKLPYEHYFGGVTIFDKQSFEIINGYSNEYFSWGAEDDDIFNRCVLHKIKLSRKNCSYKSLFHTRNIEKDQYSKNMQLLSTWHERTSSDGLNSLKYTLISREKITDKSEKITVSI